LSRDFYSFLFAFVAYEKGFGELGKVERCNPSLALGACASELFILRPLVVNNVSVSHYVVTIPRNRTKVKRFLSLFSIFYYLLNAVHKGYGKQGQKWGRKEKSNERNVVSHEVTIPQPAGKSRSFYLFFLLDRSQVK
jgi:hypothetical protein